MPFTPRLALPPGLVVPRRIDPGGATGPTAAQARGPHWHRVGKNSYRPTLAAQPPEQRIFDAVGQLPSGGAVTGWAALRVHGAAYFDGRLATAAGWVDRPVLLAAGRSEGRRAAAGVLFSYEPLPPEEVQVVHGLRVTTPSRALFDELRTLKVPRRALVATEMAVAARVVTLDEMRVYAQLHRRRRRSLAAIAVLDRARPGARSPKEVELRDLLELGTDLPLLGINVPVFDLHENFLLEADLLGVERGMVVEYDGEDHGSSARRARDAERADLCRRHGLEHVTIVGPDLARPARIVDRVQQAWERARPVTDQVRTWTTEWPPGWAPWW
ncbi:hypothetical protein [Nocardioides marmoribigeumensis]|uniref:DUF559 domain-containing protein n=1 Tax=Nocardioides marmoribigeumensis TaxID=433649 RepID=A0ABU2BWR4_9ACTN|nr:hypothetical protein [Nocardioides marmoribigeumensis]MDR7362044.1 hypothetical protein [Nocardioides marmoribigeumensis]